MLTRHRLEPDERLNFLPGRGRARFLSLSTRLRNPLWQALRGRITATHRIDARNLCFVQRFRAVQGCAAQDRWRQAIDPECKAKITLFTLRTLNIQGLNAQSLRKTIVPLVPPKPKEFDNATSIFIGLASLGT